MDEVSLREIGRDAYEKGDFNLAASYYRQVLELYPNDYKMIAKLGSLFSLQSDFSAAAKVYHDGIAKMESRKEEGEMLGDMHISLAQAYLSLNRFEEAQAELEIAGQTGANPANLCEARGRGYNVRGEYGKALAAYQEYSRLEPNKKYGYLGMARAYEGLKRYDLAADALKSAKTLTPDDYWVEIALGNLAITLKDYNTALNHYESAKELAPHKPAVTFSLGQAYMMMNDYETAREMFLTTLKGSPNDAASLYNLAQIEIIEHNEEQAIVLLKSAISIDPSNHAYYVLLNQTQIASGKWLDSIRTALKAKKHFRRQQT